MPNEVTDAERETIRNLHAAGKINSEIARKIGRSNSIISKQMQRMGLLPNTIAKRNLARFHANNERLREAPKMQSKPAAAAPIHERYAADRRPAAIKGEDLLLERMKAGAR